MNETIAPQMTADRLQALDAYFAQALASWGHPGLAVTLVQDDTVIFARGYGVRRAGGGSSQPAPEPVNAQTVFGIGSATKSFTAAAVGVLVDRGLLDWDTPIQRWLPGWRLADLHAAAETTLRDLLCHRTGLPRGVRVRLRSRCDLDTYIERMGRVPLRHPFRSEFHYTNTTFDIAGKVVEAASGLSWGDFVRQEIFEPLGMSRACVEAREVGRYVNRAEPHGDLSPSPSPEGEGGKESPDRLSEGEGGEMLNEGKGGYRVLEWLDIQQDPAGSISASMVDMAQWLRLMINQGRFGERQVLSPESWREITSMQMAIPHPERTDLVLLQMLGADMQFWGYGLGWFVQDYRGRKIVWHAGQINGFSAMVGFLPRERFGFALVTNVHETLLHGALMFAALDAYLGVQERDWSAECQAGWGMFLAQEAAQAQAGLESRRKDTTPSLPLAAYAGEYRSDWWGELRLALEGERLAVHYGGRAAGALEHWHYDTFRLAWDDPLEAPDTIVFHLDAQGEVKQFELEGYTTFERIKK